MDKKEVTLEHLVKVKSSNIASVGYNEGSAFVEFNNGGIYQYNNVDVGVFHDLAKAESVGKTFGKTLRSHKDFEKLSDTVLVKRQLSDEEMENEVINRLRYFSDNKMHESSTGTQRTVAKRLIEYVKENS